MLAENTGRMNPPISAYRRYPRLKWPLQFAGGSPPQDPEHFMSRRFFIKGPLEPGHVRLTGAEAHQFVHVLRIGRGQSVTLFDGSGFEAVAELQSTAEDAVELTVREVRTASAEPAVRIVLASAVPKGDRFAWLIEKATELGIER